MIKPQENIINQFLLDVETLSEREAFRFQEQWTSSIQDVFLQVLDETFKQVVLTDEFIYIDHLVLDLGAVGRLDADILKTKFKQLLEQNVLAQRDQAVHNSTAGKNKAFKPEEKLPYALGSPIHTLLYFLRSGNLPWWQKVDSFDCYEVIQSLLIEEPQLLKKEIQLLAASHPVGIFRLYDILYNTQLLSLPSLFQIKQSQVLEWGKALTKQLFDTPAQRQHPKQIEHFVFLQLILQGKIEHEPESKATTSLTDSYLSFAQKYPELTAPSIIHPANNITPGPKEVLRTPVEKALDLTPQEDKEQFLVSHAGLVLLTGFLSHAFRKLGWIEGQTFKDAESQRLAVLWLHYTVSGGKKPQEYELTLQKVICGLPPEHYLSTEANFSEDAIQEAHEILESLKVYWEKMQSTTIEGMRKTFLERKGILQRREDQSWELAIEEGPYDILLNLLPPNISLSMIVLPWLNYFIYVEWAK